jgi:hypothetical protein
MSTLPDAAGSRKRRATELQVDVERASTPVGGLPANAQPPALRRLTTPDCMSSPVSHLRDLTRDLAEDGAKRRRAAQYLRESREAHLQQRRLYLVLDLDETLVHSLRGSVRQISDQRASAAAAAGDVRATAGDGGGGGGGVASSVDRTLSERESEDDREYDDDEAHGEVVAPPVAVSAQASASLDVVAAAAAVGAGSASSVGPGPLPVGPLPNATITAPRPSSSGETSEISEGLSDADAADGAEVTLQVQNVEFEMKLRPGVHAFLREMSSLFCVNLYTMGSREYVQQALHHLDPRHEIFKPGQVLAWNPTLDRTTKTLQRLLCVPEFVLIVDDSPMAWANHLPNLILIDRYVGDPSDNSLERVGRHLKAIHKAYFEQSDPLPPPEPSSSTGATEGACFSLPAPAAAPPTDDAFGTSRRPNFLKLPSVPEAGDESATHLPRRPSLSRLMPSGARSAPRSPLMPPTESPCHGIDDLTPAAAAAVLPTTAEAAEAYSAEGTSMDSAAAAESGGESSAAGGSSAGAPPAAPLAALDVRGLLLSQCEAVLAWTALLLVRRHC